MQTRIFDIERERQIAFLKTVTWQILKVELDIASSSYRVVSLAKSIRKKFYNTLKKIYNAWFVWS